MSIAADAHRYWLISIILAVLAAGMLTVLVGWGLLKALVRHEVPIDDMTNPDVALRLFSFVAACTVLAALFQAHPTSVNNSASPRLPATKPAKSPRPARRSAASACSAVSGVMGVLSAPPR